MVARPQVGRARPSRTRMVVDFPAPFGPRNPVIRPGASPKVRSSTAVTAPSRLVSASTAMVPLTGPLKDVVRWTAPTLGTAAAFGVGRRGARAHTTAAYGI